MYSLLSFKVYDDAEGSDVADDDVGFYFLSWYEFIYSLNRWRWQYINITLKKFLLFLYSEKF